MIFQKVLLKSLATNADRLAIENGENSLTYRQLWQKANAVTQFLLAQNLSKESFIGVQTTDRATIVVSMIGIMNAGCVFVPLNPELPIKRQQVMREELDLACTITSADFAAIIDQYATASMQEKDYPVYEEEDSIYVYFTSGSSGKPKGIIGRNKSLLQYLLWELEAFSIQETCRVSQLISPFFDAFLRDVFVPLLSGGTLCLPPAEADFFTPAKIVPWIESSRITHIHCVPSVFRLINEAAVAENQFAHLQCIMMSGEKINPVELRPWYQTFGSRVQLVNFYGATETTMIRSFYLIQPEDAQQSKIPIGYPIHDTQLWVLNKNGKPCAAYVPGDLYIASPYITKGYLGDEALNQEKFVQLFAGTPHECIAFKTGDKARTIEDGKIDLLGREDRQVKIRGIRVELDEIENVMLQTGLLKNALILQAATNAENALNQPPDDGLLAFVVLAPTANADWETKLRSILKDYLPDYMTPTAVLEVKAYPLLPNGKVNYQELLQKHVVKSFVQPENPTEEQLLLIWKEILGDKAISTEDSFQQAGGNSLSIMRLIAKIYKAYNVRISLNELFNHLTIKTQAALIRKIQKDESLHIKPVALQDAYVTSSAQERMYYQYQLDKNGIAFNMPMAWELDEQVDLTKLSAALSALLSRHESLRTHFMLKDNQIFQVINETAALEILELEMPLEGVEQLIRPFDLNKAPLMRCAILSRGKQRKILFTDLHHIICDGMSQVNLFSDLLHLYTGEALQELPFQYKDYAAWEQPFKMTEDYLSHRSFWLQAFEGELPRLQLPPSRGAAYGITGRTTFFPIRYSAIEPLLQQWKQDGITDFSGLLAVYFLFMAQLSGQDDIVVGINSTGRPQDELEGVVGMFAKTLPIRFSIPAEITFNEFAKQVHQYLRQANTRQIYDYVDIVNELNRNRERPIDNLFETMLVFQNFEHRDTSKGKQLFRDYNFRQAEAKYPFTMFINTEEDGFRFRMEYQEAYFSEEDIANLVNKFEQLFTSIAANSNTLLMDFMGVEPEDALDENEMTFRF